MLTLGHESKRMFAVGREGHQQLRIFRVLWRFKLQHPADTRSVFLTPNERQRCCAMLAPGHASREQRHDFDAAAGVGQRELTY